MRATLASLVLATIAGIATAPVEVHVVLVFQKDIAVALGIRGTIDARRATVVVGQQVVMERSRRAAPLASIAAYTLLMACVVESLVDDAPLHRRIVVVVHGDILLAAPAKAAVVDDDVAGILDANGATLDEILLLRLCRVANGTQSRTDIADDDIFGAAQVQFATPQQNALARCCLTSNGHVLQFGADGTFVLTLRIRADVDDASDAEHDGGILATRLRQCPAQRALASIVEIRHLDHFAPASARGILAKALSRWEGQRLCQTV